ncbi:carbohydrate kinase family protein [Paracidovorax valerianellae]|uniref:Ribokinase n=1 Tax=Paracidovorax valerianellae TaxID=187868 RepID=A0A1G7A8T7_9BURK|nr:carbohydrate kinase family protein [Paracidovorax valerianellae]MDA8443709.1 carbohydrate kinase family protein [Paracidovorax valerianellae]SDE11239.1 ribokinase [Paracidovorax valerianellae]
MRVLTIGGATLDIVVMGAEAIPVQGAKHEVEHVGLSMGGGAVNAGLGFASFRAQVTALCAVGTDAEGQWLRASMARQGVLTESMQTIDGYPTGKAVVHLDANGDASVYAQRGASTQLTLGAIDDLLAKADVVYVSALAEPAMLQLQKALTELPHHFRLAINPGARQLAQSAQLTDGLLAAANLVCVNATEAKLLAHGRGLPHAADMDADGAAALAPLLAQHPAQCVLLTLGAEGAVFFDGQRSHYQAADDVIVVSTLGAGDAYASAFAFHWFSGHGASASLQAASRRAAAVLQVAAANLASLVMEDSRTT